VIGKVSTPNSLTGRKRVLDSGMRHIAEQFEFPFKGIFSSKKEVAALELIDSAYEIVELWEATGEYNKKWKKEWLRKARELGAQPFGSH